MKTELIKEMTDSFQQVVHEQEGVEFWLARDLQELLGYARWENFVKVIDKAKVACVNSQQNIFDHFRDTTKMVDIGSHIRRAIDNIMLTRYACYLVAQNGDPSKVQIAFAMNYFAVQTRKQEILEQRIRDWERLQAREKLTLSERKFSGIIYEKGVDSAGFSRIRSKGDQALFGGYSTQDMKNKLGVPESKPLADFLPAITIKAKDFATEITSFTVKKDGIRGEDGIRVEHVKNNADVRAVLSKNGIKPENLPAEEDLSKLKRRRSAEKKHIIRGTKAFKEIPSDQDPKEKTE